ncbi:MAG TPA: hypothetical protein VMV51_04585 [Gemmatimonadaceae bacterium]|nr:hypothetical protein [Gemmatimonadaceae bacterium]
MPALVVLTRDGCGNTAAMRRNLDEALRLVGMPTDYLVADLGALPGADPRRGYPTPTLLWGGADVFGMEVPAPPFPEPS